MLLQSKIREEIRNGKIIIDPFDDDNFTPNGYDLRLDNHLSIYKSVFIKGKIYDPALGGFCQTTCRHALDMKTQPEMYTFEIPEEGIILEPNKVYLGQTVERTHTDYYIPMIEGRSSIARLGMDVHITAGFGHIGFNGKWTLEIRVTHPLKIYPNIKVCQVSFWEPSGDISEELLYHGKYSKGNLPKSLLFEEM